MNEIISVIIPVYNCEKYIVRCLSSLVEQTYKNIEIVIVDDGSEDNSRFVIEEFIKQSQNMNIKFIKQKNKGVSSARNVGIRESTGKYITFLDADDWVEKNTYEYLLKKLKEQDVDIIKYNMYTNKILEKNYAQSNTYKFSDTRMNKKEINAEFLEYILGGKITCSMCLVMIKREIIEQNKLELRENIAMGEDKDFFIKLLVNIDSIYVDSSVLYHYFYNENSATHRKDKYEKYIKDNIKLNQYILNTLREKNLLTEKIQQMLNNIMIISIERNIFYIYIVSNFKTCIQIFEKYRKDIQKELDNYDGKFLENSIMKHRKSINYIKNNQIIKLKLSYIIEKQKERIKNILRKIKTKLKEIL